ncbi:MAG: hypothetical protein JXR52_10470, partial [Bacteroidales bacterium]|nr:hypothetical protein [Bacteroidales bacterium]MBN2699236.1 hypothetical protein [Bacteroidales bacterium]
MKNIRFFLITLLSFAAISLFGQNPPTWNPVPTDQSVECDGTDDPGGAFAAWLASNGNGTATSDVGCENLSYSNDYNVANWISDCGNTRHVTVVFTATDDCGSTNASATFSIVDTEAPVADQAADALDATVACDDAAALTAALAL